MPVASAGMHTGYGCNLKHNRIGETGRYSIKHSIDVAIICEVIGQALGVPAHERLPVIAATLTENIAMTPLSDILYSQAAPLTDEQRKEIQRHPARGVERLHAFGVNDQVWVNAVLKHHESSDGRGYPEGLKGEAVPVYARIDRNRRFLLCKDFRPQLSVSRITKSQ